MQKVKELRLFIFEVDKICEKCNFVVLYKIINQNKLNDTCQIKKNLHSVYSF